MSSRSAAFGARSFAAWQYSDERELIPTDHVA
jgi:hypothetical protein